MLNFNQTFQFFLIIGSNSITIKKGCDTEEDKDLVQVLENKSICYKTYISSACEFSCNSSVDIFCSKVLREHAKNKNILTDPFRIPDDPTKCNEVSFESCSCTNDFCNDRHGRFTLHSDEDKPGIMLSGHLEFC